MYKKVKCTLVQALRLRTGRTAHRWSRGIALLFHDHGTRRGLRGQCHAPAALYSRERPPVPIVQEAGWAPGPIWTGAENLAPHRDSIPRFVNPAASRYTDYATPAHYIVSTATCFNTFASLQGVYNDRLYRV